ncbi:hypothetical protein IPH92_01310 [Candidatus Kaiserbacteria bacterium]|nr:MAG: hypothetical protein IPH92_01310 [Candidatus Kaiserbacteria bacterium]
MKITYVYGILVVALLVGLVFVRNNTEPKEAPVTAEAVSIYDSFAQCITDAGAKFYGTYWCPHCKDQKALFKNSKKLPYIECSTPNGQGQLPVCTDAKITGYPTWVFTDGSRLSGQQTFETLAEKTNCAVPQQ